MSGRIVRRPHHDMVLTPETTASVHFKVSLRCGKCRVPRELAPAYALFDKVGHVDWVTILERVRFRCRCGSLADALVGALICLSDAALIMFSLRPLVKVG